MYINETINHGNTQMTKNNRHACLNDKFSLVILYDAIRGIQFQIKLNININSIQIIQILQMSMLENKIICELNKYALQTQIYVSIYSYIVKVYLHISINLILINDK